LFTEVKTYKDHFEFLHSTTNCEICTALFSTVEELEQHVTTSHILVNYTCTVCEKAFGRHQTRFVQHIIEPHKCNRCNIKIPIAKQDHHAERHWEEGSFLCRFCQETLPTLRDVQKHVNEHFARVEEIFRREDDAFKESEETKDKIIAVQKHEYEIIDNSMNAYGKAKYLNRSIPLKARAKIMLRQNCDVFDNIPGAKIWSDWQLQEWKEGGHLPVQAVLSQYEYNDSNTWWEESGQFIL
jgi:hypothetical protein